MVKMKLYISDLDGTLLNRNKEIGEFTKDTINALTAKGIYFSVATARTAESAVEILSGININVPVVLMNGVAIFDICKDKYIKTEFIPEQTVNAIVNTLNDHGLTGFMYTISGNKLTTYYESLKTVALQDFYNERVKNYNRTFEQTDSFFHKTSGNTVIYFTLIDRQKPLAVIANSLKKLPGIDFTFYKDIYNENLWYLEVFSKTASKYNAVKYLRDHYHFDRIVGFGDNFNDMPLFDACDECYAVFNAVEELRSKATGVIGDNNSHGVARFIAEREGLGVGLRSPLPFPIKVEL